MKNSVLMFIFTITFLISSCGKGRPSLDNRVVDHHDLKVSRISCKNLDLNINLLEKTNLNNLFLCVGWDKEFPLVYEYLTKLSHKESQLLIEPINRHVFSSFEKRNKFLMWIQAVLNKSSVGYLTENIHQFLDNSQLRDITKSLMQHENWNLPDLAFMQNIFGLVGELIALDENSRLALRYNLLQAMENKEVRLHLEKNLINFFDVMIDKNHLFLKSVPSFIGSADWITHFFKRYTDLHMTNLLVYAQTDSTIAQKADFLQTALQSGLYNCYEWNGVYAINYQVELRNRLESMASEGEDLFYMNLLDLSERFSLYKNICPYPEFNNASANILKHLRSFTLLPGGYDFLKRIFQTSIELRDDFLAFKLLRSESFHDLSRLIYLTELNKLEIGSAVYDYLKSFDLKTFERTTNFFKSYLSSSFDLSIVKSLSIDQKKYLAKSFVVEFLLNSTTNDESIKVAQSFINDFSEIYRDYKLLIEENKLLFARWFEGFDAQLREENFKQELKNFLSEKNLFRLVSILVDAGRDQKKEELVEFERPITGQFLDETSHVTDSSIVTCLQKFHDATQRSDDFWYLLDNYPRECIELIQKRSLTSQIFLWTIDIDRKFKTEFGSTFSVNYGMIAPEMMSFYLSLMHIINTPLKKDDNYIRRIVTNIQKELFEYGLMDLINSSVKLISYTAEKTSFFDKLNNQIIKAHPQEVDSAIKGLLQLINLDSIQKKYATYSCHALSPRSGAQSCLSKDDFKRFVDELAYYLRRSNGSEKKLYEMLVDFLVGEDGISLPFDSKRQYQKNFRLEELVRFLFDLTHEKSKKKITFTKGAQSVDLLADNAERLEIVIREISFLNNFYGAFFMNTVARAKNYSSKVKKLKKNIKIMDRSSGFFRDIGIFPEKTKWAFKNIMQTYDSLIELDQPHLQTNGTKRQYGGLIQAILTLVVASSSPESQSYSPFQKPKTEMLDNHNGMFITKLTEIGILSHLGNWLRKISNNDIDSILENEKFKVVDQNFNLILSKQVMNNVIKEFLEGPHHNLMVSDFADLIFDANHQRRDYLLNIFFDIVYLLANNKNELIEKNFLKFFKVFSLHYESIRELLAKKDADVLLKIVSDSLNKLSRLARKDQALMLNILGQVMESFSLGELEQLLVEEESLALVSNMIDSIVNYSLNPEYNTGVMSSILQDNSLTFAPVHKMLRDIWQKEGSLKYLENILRLLAKESEGKTYAEHALVELFINAQEELEDFLTDVFDRFYRQRAILSH